jgi:uncharacterized protein YjbJ (UPF0337 family)
MANQMTTQDPGASERAGQMAGAARDEARDVAGDARQEAKAVASEAATQVHNVVDSTRSALRTQARENTDRATGALGELGSQFRALAEGDREGAGQLGRYADEAGTRLRTMADRLNSKGFDGVVDDVQVFARRRPGTFLAIAAATGFVAGRLFRGAQAASSSSDTRSATAPEVGSGYGEARQAPDRTYETPSATPVPPLTTGAAQPSQAEPEGLR